MSLLTWIEIKLNIKVLSLRKPPDERIGRFLDTTSAQKGNLALTAWKRATSLIQRSHMCTHLTAVLTQWLNLLFSEDISI